MLSSTSNSDKVHSNHIAASVRTFDCGLCPFTTAVSTKVVSQKCESVRDNADWYNG